MASQAQIHGRYIVAMMTLLADKNYTLLGGLLHNQHMDEFSSKAAYRRLRKLIFGTLGTQVHERIMLLWDPCCHCQGGLTELLIFDRITAGDWPTGHWIWTTRRHRHNVLLKNWDMSYPFTMTAHTSEACGLDPELVEEVEKALEARKVVDAKLKNSCMDSTRRQPNRSPAQSSISTSDLFYSPTAQATKANEQVISEAYHDAAHGLDLRRPVRLADNNQPRSRRIVPIPQVYSHGSGDA